MVPDAGASQPERSQRRHLKAEKIVHFPLQLSWSINDHAGRSFFLLRRFWRRRLQGPGLCSNPLARAIRSTEAHGEPLFLRHGLVAAVIGSAADDRRADPFEDLLLFGDRALPKVVRQMPG